MYIEYSKRKSDIQPVLQNYGRFHATVLVRHAFARLLVAELKCCGICDGWKMGKRRIVVKTVYGLLLAAAVLMLSGCTLLSEERIKLRDLDFTVLSEEKIPAELMTIIEEKKSAPFQITYTDNENLYICVGYGQQETGGYSIAVEELYLTDTNICVDTTLLGPEASEKSNKTPSFPFIVLKTEFLEQTVIFE